MAQCSTCILTGSLPPTGSHYSSAITVHLRKKTLNPRKHTTPHYSQTTSFSWFLWPARSRPPILGCNRHSQTNNKSASPSITHRGELIQCSLDLHEVGLQQHLQLLHVPLLAAPAAAAAAAPARPAPAHAAVAPIFLASTLA